MKTKNVVIIKFNALLLGVLMLLNFSCNSSREAEAETETLDAYVVLVSFDGFRWDYNTLFDTPNFDDLAMSGVKAERMIPSFPTKTFPNHYTLATGLYPDHHGIINNSFYAAELGGIYRMGDRNMVSNPDAYFGEPIWNTAEEQGIKSACYFWIGSEAPIQGTYPTYWKQYNESVPYADRVDQVITWLKKPIAKRPGLITLYFDEPDGISHELGPVHSSTGEVVEYLDSILGYLRCELDALEYSERINLIVLSDHGLGPTSPEKYINMYDYIRDEWSVSMVGANPVYLIEPVAGYADSITTALNNVTGINAWQKDEIPERLHFGSSSRFPGIVVVADSLWRIGTTTVPRGYVGGAHGYDNAFTDMHTIFYADGPAFRDGIVIPAFSNVEVYGIIAHILGLQPAHNDGDLSHISGMFSPE